MRSDAQKKSLHAAEQQRPDVAAARENWRAAQPHLDPDRLVFIDETWATTNMTRRYGRAPPGQRLVAAVPHGHWEIVILDNLGSHKVAGVRDAIQARGATLVCLPPYSPDRNPIEQAFAKLKTLLRKLAARTVSSLWNALGDLLDRFTPQECANYLASAGYVPFNRNPLSRGFHDCLPGTPARTVGHLRFPRFEGSASPRRASQYEDRNRHQRVARDPS